MYVCCFAASLTWSSLPFSLDLVTLRLSHSLAQYSSTDLAHSPRFHVPLTPPHYLQRPLIDTPPPHSWQDSKPFLAGKSSHHGCLPKGKMAERRVRFVFGFENRD
ncbi:hypothetical protein DFP73DRAFT_96315 [Morchella snyderi]|nr:hypothetical protein DFP73DRAFT_96315 [Morchella snyderi]